jgi:hypothetical protein
MGRSIVNEMSCATETVNNGGNRAIEIGLRCAKRIAGVREIQAANALATIFQYSTSF